MKELLLFLNLIFGVSMENDEYRQALLKAQLKMLQEMIPKPKGAEINSNVEGDVYDVSFYCPCPTCCGKSSPERGGHGLTASGRPPKEGETVAADWAHLPKGTRIDIEGYGPRVVHDTGSAIKGKRLDIFMKSHEEAKKAGRKRLRVKRLSDAGN